MRLADVGGLPCAGEGTSNNYAYLVVDDKSKDAVIIDPANPPEYVCWRLDLHFCTFLTNSGWRLS